MHDYQLLYVIIGCQFQWSFAFERVFCACACPSLHEQGYNSSLAALSRVMQRRPAIVVEGVDVSPEIEKLQGHFHLARDRVEYNVVKRSAACMVLQMH